MVMVSCKGGQASNQCVFPKGKHLRGVCDALCWTRATVVQYTSDSRLLECVRKYTFSAIFLQSPMEELYSYGIGLNKIINYVQCAY